MTKTGYCPAENTGLTTLTYAAPVIINQNTVNVGVVIQFEANGKPRAVNVAYQSGKPFRIKITKASKGLDSRVNRYGQGMSLPTMDASTATITPPGESVNSNSPEHERYSKNGVSFNSTSPARTTNTGASAFTRTRSSARTESPPRTCA